MFVVRRAFDHEYHKYADHLKALDSESKRLRFTCNVSDYFIDQLVKTVIANSDKHILFVVENDKFEFIGVGHLALGEDTEIALSVLKDHQGQGIGNALMQRMIKYCRIKRYLKGYMLCLPTNYAIRHLCDKYNVQVQIQHDDAIGTVEFAEPTFITYLDENASSNLEFIDFINRRILSMWSLGSYFNTSGTGEI